MDILSRFFVPDSPIHLEQRNIKAILDKRELGHGTLYISERTLCWHDGPIGFTLAYQNISLHAISNDPILYPAECIYVMIDSRARVSGIEYVEVAQDSDEEENSEAELSELVLVPDDANAIIPMYDAIKTCQALNSDEPDILSDDEDEDEDIYEDADDDFIAPTLNDIGAGGDNDMEHLVNQLRNNSVDVNYDYSNGDHNINDDIFEDAD